MAQFVPQEKRTRIKGHTEENGGYPAAEFNAIWPGRQYTKPFGGPQVMGCAKGIKSYQEMAAAKGAEHLRVVEILETRIVRNGRYCLIESISQKNSNDFPSRQL